MNTKTATIILVVLLVLGALLLLALVYGYAAEGAVKAALADQDTYATSAQRSTTVCVGLFNGCDTVQSATTTAQRTTPAEGKGVSTIDLLLVLAASVVLLFGMGVVVFRDDLES